MVGSLVSSRCGAFPPVDGFCVGGHAVEEAGDELDVSAAASGEAELPQFCGGTVVVVDRLIRGIGVDLSGAVAVDLCPDVAEKSGQLRFVVDAARGTRVIGAASAANQNYLSLLGAEPVAYGEGMIERVRALAPDGVDVALDVAGSGVLPQLIDLAGGSQNVVTLADFDGSKEHGVRFSNGFADGHAFHSLAEVRTPDMTAR